MRRFKVPSPSGITSTHEVVVWASGFCNADNMVSIEGDIVTVETEGDFTAPGAVEVPYVPATQE